MLGLTRELYGNVPAKALTEAQDQVRKAHILHLSVAAFIAEPFEPRSDEEHLGTKIVAAPRLGTGARSRNSYLITNSIYVKRKAVIVF